jgi:hypothetical protein
VVHPGQHGDHTAEVVALLAGWLGTADHEVVDVGAVQLGHLGEGFLDHQPGQVVGTQVAQRPLAGAADG